MNRFDYASDKTIRPPILYRELIIEDLSVGFSPRCVARVTIYKKDKTILAIAHDVAGSKITIGEGADRLWPYYKQQYKDFDLIMVQGYNDFYEYVNLYENLRKVRSGGTGFMEMF